MAVQPLNTLKSWAIRGWKPLAVQVKDWFDSFWHKDELIPINKIENLESTLNGFATQASVESIIDFLFCYRLVLNANGTYVIPAGFKMNEMIVTPQAESDIVVSLTPGGGEVRPSNPEDLIPANGDLLIQSSVIARVDTTIYIDGIVSPTTILIYKQTLAHANP